MAEIAPNEFAKKVIKEFSEDEKYHALCFQDAYYLITENYYSPSPLKPISIKNYDEALITMIQSETESYKNYSDKYLSAPDKYLENLFYFNRTSKMQHAIRIATLMLDK